MKGKRRVVRRHTDLEVYRRAFEAAMRIFELSKSFPREERYSLIDQIRRSSRSVCSNMAEAWRKRRWEAAETQVWLEFAVRCDYLSRDAGKELCEEYDAILAMLIDMITHPEEWLLPRKKK